MKNIFLLLLLSSLTIISCEKASLSPNGTDDSISANRRGRGADDPTLPPPANLPAVVLKSFNTRYPTATRMEWEPEDGNTWKVKFFLGTVRWMAVFRADGTFISAQIKR
jgi:hypothetical protein